ncbi:hypothetical protein DAPPUDRAFT_241302 [Daphnia pulex]|uniref:Apple domain-containing protein n=1 Tax=Daphnia pulex TaxID=6669 RepID=E9GDX6_DAPPU|nr:hypothetical protein DAPPUDRAFT_241302 [Daphnia pulex]|eukprot:EFX82163.1 hypothetical protein DAPPUDRAFT_241302 [Daphnia pulex]
MTSDVERSKDAPTPKVFEPSGDVSVSSTPDDVISPPSDDVAVTESIIQTESVDAQQLASPVDVIKADDVITESVPTADQPAAIPSFIADVKSTAALDEIIITPSVNQSDDGVVPVNSTITETTRAADQIGNCVVNLAIPNRNIPSVTYSTNCDFCNHDMYALTCIPNAFACASLCAGDRRCSHFTYVANLLGGTCRLKSAPGSGGSWASPIQAPSPYVCGYIGRRAFQNVLLGLCLALDINVNIE